MPIHVTSGERDVVAQARAMLEKYQGGDDLHKLYGADDVIDKLLQAERTVAAWTRVLETEIARGANVSRHLGGGAIDIRSKDITASDIAAIVAGVKALGGRTIVEKIPPHIHADLPKTYADMRGGSLPATSASGKPRPRRRSPTRRFSISAVAAAAGGLVVLGIIWKIKGAKHGTRLE